MFSFICDGCLSLLSIATAKYLRMGHLKGKKFILAHGSGRWKVQKQDISICLTSGQDTVLMVYIWKKKRMSVDLLCNNLLLG